MSHLSTAVEVLLDEVNKALKPNLIASGYYTEAVGAMDDVEVAVGRVHQLMAHLRVTHLTKHAPGPMSLCGPTCKMVDTL